MKKLINKKVNIVNEALAGFALAHKNIVKVDFNLNYTIRARCKLKGKVAIVSGGGCGHEPMHAGYVGEGMLDAACAGDIFIPPNHEQIVAAAEKVYNDAGILFIIKNFVGDVLNFEIAESICRSKGMKVNTVIIDDDVAVYDSLYTAGRRGLGTTIIAEKICGAAAEKGYNLPQITKLCKKVNSNGRSMGVALTSCIVPDLGRESFNLSNNEIEMGIGIHGEAGRERMEVKSAKEIIEIIGDVILKELKIKNEEKLIAIINGMGGTPLIELYLLFNDLINYSKKKSINIHRELVGNYITSLEMQGFSLTLAKADDEMIELWDAPVETVALRW